MKETQIRALAEAGIHFGKQLHGTLEETHISWIVLTRRFAFKIKKPLKFSFLDYSSLAKRKKFCKKELALNRRFSDIYLSVVPIRFQHGVWRLGRGPGKIVDYAVQMKRMDSSRRMDLVLQARKVTPANIMALSKSISSFHERARIIDAPFNLEFSRKAFNDIRVIRSFVSKAFPEKYSSLVNRSIVWSDKFLRRHKERFQRRVLAGFKRDVHGDLHSGNIFLYQHPVIFDCIEFNDTYRQIDVLDEIAFFCMDLEALSQKRLSEKFMNEYSRRLSCFQQAEDKRIFNYFKCYRANVRAKVHALAAKQERDPILFSNHARWVRKYLRLMAVYMRQSGTTI